MSDNQSTRTGETQLIKVEGFSLEINQDGTQYFTMVPERIIPFLQKHVNTRGFIDGVIIRNPNSRPTSTSRNGYISVDVEKKEG